MRLRLEIELTINVVKSESAEKTARYIYRR